MPSTSPPDRALRMLAEASKVSPKAGKQTDEDRHTLADFLHFCPVIAIEGSRMQASTSTTSSPNSNACKSSAWSMPVSKTAHYIMMSCSA